MLQQERGRFTPLSLRFSMAENGPMTSALSISQGEKVAVKVLRTQEYECRCYCQESSGGLSSILPTLCLFNSAATIYLKTCHLTPTQATVTSH